MERVFVSPARYVQGPAILSDLGSAVASLGSVAVLVADDTVHDIVGAAIEESLAASDISLTALTFAGECTATEIDRLARAIEDTEVDIVIGAGGGKALDAAKGVRGLVGGALVTVPTIASTDSPTSGVSVLYDDASRLDTGRVHDRHPELVYVDTAVIAEAPTRYFVSGIGDALATQFEADAVAAQGATTVTGGQPTCASRALVDECARILRSQGRDAVTAVRADEVTPAVADVTEAIILLSGLGFENGGLAGAHAVHDGIARTTSTTATHGEKVCFGLLTQLALEDRDPDERAAVTEFAASVGLPTTLTELQLEADDATLAAIAEAVCRRDSTMWNQPETVTPDAVVEAMRAADSMGQRVKRDN